MRTRTRGSAMAPGYPMGRRSPSRALSTALSHGRQTALDGARRADRSLLRGHVDGEREMAGDHFPDRSEDVVRNSRYRLKCGGGAADNTPDRRLRDPGGRRLHPSPTAGRCRPTAPARPWQAPARGDGGRMDPIRVLVVDDSVVVRKIVTDVLSEDPAIEVVGTAVNGRIAVAKVAQLEPDLVTMDIEMPEMNGIEAVRAIRAGAGGGGAGRGHGRVPIIMFSTLTERGASATLDALSAGANEYVTKPANVGSVGQSMESVREQLIPKIKALTGRPVTPTRAAVPIPPPRPPAPRTGP